jgi:4,5-dihydroxyphthalate decarboxylase
MSGRIHLSLACGTYDINRGLIEGAVQAQGIDLTVVTASSPERHWRMARHREFDVCEFSMGTYLMIHARPASPFLAIPAFPHRRFRHSFIFVNTGAGIRTPKDLEGRSVGLRSWQTTAGLWVRGILQDEYGVDLRKVRWLTQDAEDVPFTPPPGLVIERVPEGASVTEMLETGEIGALIYPEMPDALLAGDPRIGRLFSDYKQVEMDYVRKTGFFPIMHTVVIQKPVLEADPWAAASLLDAFRASKDLAFRRMRDPRSISLAWVRELIEEQQAVLGDDPWCYEFAPNRAALETMIRWSHEQGMIDDAFPPEELFAASTLERAPAYV